MNYLYTESFRPFNCGNDKQELHQQQQPVIEITFCTRDFAEAAMRIFPQFHGRQLSMSFAAPPLAQERGVVEENADVEMSAAGDSISVVEVSATF